MNGQKEYLTGFNWSLPTAFIDAIAICKFTKGDILYNSKVGYKRWGDAIKELKHSIQVKSPQAIKSTLTQKYLEDDIDINIGSFVEANWDTEVQLELTHYQPSITKETITTTQGKLFTMLWRGDLYILTQNISPELPIMVKAAYKYLKEKDAKSKFTSLYNIDKPNMFIMPYDLTNAVLRKKYRNILSKIKSKYEVVEHELTPKQCDISNAGKYFPTIIFKCIAVDTSKIEDVRDIIKKVLWTKKESKNATKTIKDFIKSNKSLKTSHFRLSRHGLYIPSKEKGFGDIRILTFNHKSNFYRYRLAITKKRQCPKKLETYFDILFTDCPNHIFNESDFRVTKAINKCTIDIDTTYKKIHKLINLSKESRNYKECKSRHENLQKYLLENDKSTISTEVPVWVEPGEFKDYFEVFKNKNALTGHIDIVRLELDNKIGVWDYKPNAYDEELAHIQVYLYTFMLAVRTGLPLSKFVCGYFDEIDLFSFNPDYVKEITIKN